MSKTPTYQAVKMQVPLVELFTETHKATIVKVLGEIPNVEQLRTIVITPVYLLKEKQGSGKLGNFYDSYEVTIVSDYRLISSILDKSIPRIENETMVERNTLIAESLMENIYSQYSEILNYQ